MPKDKPTLLALAERLREALLEIELSAAGNGPFSRDRDADTLRAIELRCRLEAAAYRAAMEMRP